MEIGMPARLSRLERVARYRKQLNVATLVAVGLWIGWIAWMTRPGAIDAPVQPPAWCTRAAN